jgi:hypothetical protein
MLYELFFFLLTKKIAELIIIIILINKRERDTKKIKAINLLIIITYFYAN